MGDTDANRATVKQTGQARALLQERAAVKETGWAREGGAEGDDADAEGAGQADWMGQGRRSRGGQGLVGGGVQASRVSRGRWMLVTDTDSCLFRTCIQ